MGRLKASGTYSTIKGYEKRVARGVDASFITEPSLFRDGDRTSSCGVRLRMDAAQFKSIERMAFSMMRHEVPQSGSAQVRIEFRDERYAGFYFMDYAAGQRDHFVSALRKVGKKVKK